MPCALRHVESEAPGGPWALAAACQPLSLGDSETKTESEWHSLARSIDLESSWPQPDNKLLIIAARALLLARWPVHFDSDTDGAFAEITGPTQVKCKSVRLRVRRVGCPGACLTEARAGPVPLCCGGWCTEVQVGTAEVSPTRVFNSVRVFSQAGAWPPTAHRDAGPGSSAESVDGGSARARATGGGCASSFGLAPARITRRVCCLPCIVTGVLFCSELIFGDSWRGVP